MFLFEIVYTNLPMKAQGGPQAAEQQGQQKCVCSWLPWGKLLLAFLYGLGKTYAKVPWQDEIKIWHPSRYGGMMFPDRFFQCPCWGPGLKKPTPKFSFSQEPQ